MSFRDIMAIVNNAFKEKKSDYSLSISSQAYQLFS